MKGGSSVYFQNMKVNTTDRITFRRTEPFDERSALVDKIVHGTSQIHNTPLR